jgi:hypothetical protein
MPLWWASKILTDLGREKFLSLTRTELRTSVSTLIEIAEERLKKRRKKERKEERNHINNEATPVLSEQIFAVERYLQSFGERALSTALVL